MFGPARARDFPRRSLQHSILPPTGREIYSLGGTVGSTTLQWTDPCQSCFHRCVSVSASPHSSTSPYKSCLTPSAPTRDVMGYFPAVVLSPIRIITALIVVA